MSGVTTNTLIPAENYATQFNPANKTIDLMKKIDEI
jgi:hypothetical protein